MGGRQSTPARPLGPGYPVQPQATYDVEDYRHLLGTTNSRQRYSSVPSSSTATTASNSASASYSQAFPNRSEGAGSNSPAESTSQSPGTFLERIRNLHARMVATRAYHEARVSRDSDSSGDDTDVRHQVQRRSLPILPFMHFRDFKCPVCSKMVPSDNVETHLVVCLTKPRITYNEDVLTEDKGECVICLDDLEQGQTIARLPCLCIYHKGCIDEWFERNRSCPEHPSD